MDGKHRANFLEGLALPWPARTIIGMVLPVGLGDAKIKLAFLDLTDVIV